MRGSRVASRVSPELPTARPNGWGDNYIDIIIDGDEEAARQITFVEIPALEGGYQAFYNPGAPGSEPFCKR